MLGLARGGGGHLDPRIWLRRHWDALPGALLLLTFLLLKAYGLRPAASDENIYFYLASRAAKGVLPYRDVFFAHPPVHLLPATILCLLFGPRLLLLKAIAPVAAATAGLCLWRVARLRLGRGEGLFTLLLFLFAHDLLRASSHHTGVNLALAFLCAGLLAMEHGRDLLAGGLIAGTALSAFYLAPAGMIVALVRLWRRRARGTLLIASGLATFTVVNLIGLGIGGAAYWREVYGYHLAKPSVQSALLGALTPVAFRNATLLWSLPLALGVEGLRRWLLRERGRLQSLLLVALGMVGATFLLLASLGRLYHFYFLAAFPGLALLGGHACATSGRLLYRGFFPSRGASGRDAQRLGERRRIAGICALGLVFGALGLRQVALSHLGWYQRERGEIHRYTWTPAPLLPGTIDRTLRALFWRDTRRIGSPSLGVTQYLWHESRVFTAGDRLAREVERSVPPEGTLFGDSTSTPLVALLSGRRLALDEADTNFMRFRSGVTPIAGFLRRLDQAPPAAVILHPGRGVASLPEARRWVQARYRLATTVDDPHQGRYLLYLRR